MPDKSVSKVNFDLDTVEDGPGPYVFTMTDGETGEVHTFTTLDPRRLDWKVLANVDPDDAFEVLETTFAPEDYERFIKLTVPARKLDALMDKLIDHFEVKGTHRGNRRGSRT